MALPVAAVTRPHIPCSKGVCKFGSTVDPPGSPSIPGHTGVRAADESQRLHWCALTIQPLALDEFRRTRASRLPQALASSSDRRQMRYGRGSRRDWHSCAGFGGEYVDAKRCDDNGPTPLDEHDQARGSLPAHRVLGAVTTTKAERGPPYFYARWPGVER